MLGKKRWPGIVLAMMLLIGTCSGCGSDTAEPEQESEPERGRYVEAETQLPKEEAWVTKQLFTVEGQLNLLLAAEQGDVTILRQWEQRGEEFEDVSQEWLASMELSAGAWSDMKLLQGQNGVQYLFIRMVNEEDVYQNRLWRGSRSNVEDITPQKWTVSDELYGSYEYVYDIVAMDDGTLVSVSYASVDILSGEDGSVLESSAVSGAYGEMLLSDGKNIYLTTLGSGDSVNGLEKWPEGREDDSMQIDLPVRGMTGIYLCNLEDGTVIAASAEGIFRYIPVSETWDKLLSGSETDFALTTCWCTGLAAMEDGRIYTLFRQEDGAERLVRYEYAPDAVAEVTRELKIYTIWESSLLQQAAVSYHKEHPDVLITVEYDYALTDMYSGKTPDYNQIYQSLNTMLMGSEAPDILVLDHLDIESYAEKGLLADISGVVAPLEETGELLSNITGAYAKEDGSRYVVPLQFGFTMALGRDIQAEDMADLEALAQFLAERDQSFLGPLTVSELVDQFYPFFCEEIVKGDQLDRETLQQKLECLKVIAQNSQIVEKRGEGERKYGSLALASRSKMAFEDCAGFFDCMFPIAVMEYIKGDFTAYENCFIPLLQTGINSQSEYRETAMDFLEFALSQTVQDTSRNEGFPVNRYSLEKAAAADRSEVSATTFIETEGGGGEIFDITPYSDEIAQRIFDVCLGLERPVSEDEKIREELIAALPGYLDGSRSLEQTLDAIEGALRMYLAE